MRHHQQAAGEYAAGVCLCWEVQCGEVVADQRADERAKPCARTSSQPGKTQTINFYNINDALYYVDLPGYGYAKVAPWRSRPSGGR